MSKKGHIEKICYYKQAKTKTQVKLLEKSNEEEHDESFISNESNEDLHHLHQNDNYKFNDEPRKISNTNVSGDCDAEPMYVSVSANGVNVFLFFYLLSFLISSEINSLYI